MPRFVITNQSAERVLSTADGGVRVPGNASVEVELSARPNADPTLGWRIQQLTDPVEPRTTRRPMVASVSAAYAVAINDEVLLVDSSSAAFAIALPPGASHLTGRVVLKDAGGSAQSNNITIAPDGGETCDLAALTNDDESATLVFSGGRWHQV